MSQFVRWMVAGLVTLAVASASIWVSETLVLPLWIKSAPDRWVVATAIGVVLGGLTALWGVSFAQATGTPTDSLETQPSLRLRAEASEHGRVNQAGRDQIIGANLPSPNSDDQQVNHDVRLQANASGHGQVNQAGRDQIIHERDNFGRTLPPGPDSDDDCND